MILRLIEEVIAAAVGTMAFALMFHVPRQYYFCGGIAGGAGWLVYRALELHVDSLMGPVCAGAFTVVFLSQSLQIPEKMSGDHVSDPGDPSRWYREWGSIRRHRPWWEATGIWRPPRD
ncbi:MAG: threonine/serine exporter family protein [Lachnospiraceae bacterium]